MLKLLRKSVRKNSTDVYAKKNSSDASGRELPTAASVETRQTDASERKNSTDASEKAHQIDTSADKTQTAVPREVRAAHLRLHPLAIETERPAVASENGHPTLLSATEYVTVAFMETPVRYLADLPDLEPGDKVIREDGLIYTIAGDYDSLVSSDGVYYDPITLMPYSDQEKAAVECEDYPMENWIGQAMRSSRHRERFDEYYAEMEQKGQVVGENGFTTEQARRAEIEMRKFDKEDEQALEAACD